MSMGRRRFLQAMFGAACGVVIADDVLDVLDRIAPRPVMVPGADLLQPRGLVGLREELADLIYNISPCDTPLINMLTPANSHLLEWQTDVLVRA